MALTQVETSGLSGSGASSNSTTGNVFSQTGPFKNRIINGDMRIDQRNAGTGASVGTGTSGTYGPDRFWGYTGTGSVWTTSRVSTGNTDFPFANRLQRANGSSSTAAIFWRQIIESANCSDLAGQTVTLSLYVTAGTNYSGGALSVNVFTGTGSDQGATSLNTAAWTSLATPVNSTITPTTTRTRYTFTATLGATVQEVAVGLTFTPTGTAGANDFIDITGVQLEAGSVATPFERRSYGQELALCQRYYYRIYGSDTDANTGPYGLGVSQTSTTGRAVISLPVTMRTSPTALEQSGTASHYRVILGSSGSSNCSAVPVFASSSKTSIDIQWTVASGATLNQGVIFMSNNAASYIGASAEL